MKLTKDVVAWSRFREKTDSCSRKGIKLFRGGTDGQGKDREQNTTEKGDSTHLSVLMKVKAALQVHIRDSTWVNTAVKEILPVPHWRSKSLNQSLKQLQKTKQSGGLACVKSWIVPSFSTLVSQIPFLLVLLALSSLPSRIPMWSQTISQASSVSVLSWSDLLLILQLRNDKMVGYHMYPAFSCHCLGRLGFFVVLMIFFFFNTRHMQIILSYISSALSKPKYSALDSGLIWTLMHTIGFWFCVSVTEENELLPRDVYLHH